MVGNVLVCAFIEEAQLSPLRYREVVSGGLKAVKDHRFRSAPLRSSTASKVVLRIRTVDKRLSLVLSLVASLALGRGSLGP